MLNGIGYVNGGGMVSSHLARVYIGGQYSARVWIEQLQCQFVVEFYIEEIHVNRRILAGFLGKKS